MNEGDNNPDDICDTLAVGASVHHFETQDTIRIVSFHYTMYDVMNMR